tara:strand:- start:628 stop:849 length:222 start_codon:yes stop_codon:yes gene_type:complete
MKNQKSWEFAQQFSSKELIKIEGILPLASLVSFRYKLNEKIATLFGLSVLFLAVIILIIRIENAIKNKLKEKN